MNPRRSLSEQFPLGTNSLRHRLKKLLQIILIGGGVILLHLFINQQRIVWQNTSLHIWYTAEQKIKRPPHINRDHGYCGLCPADKQLSTAWQLEDIITHLPSSDQFLVNIGAASVEGGIYDPTCSLLNASDSSFGALLIDPKANPAFFSAYPRRSNIRIVHDYIWSESIISGIFQKYNVSKNFTLLKIDVDSYECSLLDAILRADYRPQLIHTEFNPIFPPPVVFMPIYDPKTKLDWRPALWAHSGPFYGCSLSALSKVLRLYDYLLVEVDFWDVIYIQRELVQAGDMQVPANDMLAFEHGFASHSCSPYCRENPKLYNGHISSAIESGMNQSNFTAYMTNVIDQYAPISMRNKRRHPYIITI